MAMAGGCAAVGAAGAWEAAGGAMAVADGCAAIGAAGGGRPGAWEAGGRGAAVARACASRRISASRQVTKRSRAAPP